MQPRQPSNRGDRRNNDKNDNEEASSLFLRLPTTTTTTTRRRNNDNHAPDEPLAVAIKAATTTCKNKTLSSSTDADADNSASSSSSNNNNNNNNTITQKVRRKRQLVPPKPGAQAVYNNNNNQDEQDALTTQEHLTLKVVQGKRNAQLQLRGNHQHIQPQQQESSSSDAFQQNERSSKLGSSSNSKQEKNSPISVNDKLRFRPPTFFRYAGAASPPQPQVLVEEATMERQTTIINPNCTPRIDHVDFVVPVATLVQKAPSAHIIVVEQGDNYDDDESMTVETPKPVWYRRKVVWISIALLVLLVALIASLVVGLGGGSGGSGKSQTPPTVAPTMYPTASPTEWIDLNTMFGDIPLVFAESYKSALTWVQEQQQQVDTNSNHNTTMLLTRSNLQRFIMAWFYFSTTNNGQDPWLSCNPHENDNNNNSTTFILDSEENSTLSSSCNFLVDPSVLYGNADVSLCYAYPEVASRPWLDPSTWECEWAGITCNERGDITHMELSGVGLSGPFPYFLVVLPYLQTLDLSLGGLSGVLPDELANFPSLQEVKLSRNQLQGSLPSNIFSGRISKFDLSFNNLSGTIPDGLESVTQARLQNNYFTGTLPEMDSAGNLESLYLYKNIGWEGQEIPASWGRLNNLAVLDIHGNGLAGSLPQELTGWTSMQALDLSDNNFNGLLPEMPWDNLRSLAANNNAFTDVFPESLYGHNGVGTIDLSFNQFRGNLSDSFHGMLSLRVLDLRNNEFTGSIPSSLATASSRLQTIRLQFNEFEGMIPNEFCEPFNGLTLEADCLTDITEADTIVLAANVCAEDCCSKCCNRETGACFEPYPPQHSDIYAICYKQASLSGGRLEIS